MFPCLCAQGSSIAEYLDFSRIAVKRDTCVLVCLYALRGFTRPSYISGGEGGGLANREPGSYIYIYIYTHMYLYLYR